MELSKICDMGCEILKRTKDGDSLEPQHLKLLENAVNGYLNDAGIDAFKKLYEDVTEGRYIKPFLHGIEHMTYDAEGYVYYKEICVEHYSRDYAYSACARNHLLDIKKRCEFLESKGIEVSCGSAVLNWGGEIADEYGAIRLGELESLFDSSKNSLMYSTVSISHEGSTRGFITMGNASDVTVVMNHEITWALVAGNRRLSDKFAVSVTVYAYGHGEPLPGEDAALNKKFETALNLCHGYIRDKELARKLSEKRFDTDFAGGMENTLRLEAFLQGRTLDYTKISVYERHNFLGVFYMLGAPDLNGALISDDMLKLAEPSGYRVNLHIETFRFGGGEPADVSQWQNTGEIKRFLQKNAGYMADYGLSKRIASRRHSETETRFYYADKADFPEGVKELIQLIRPFGCSFDYTVVTLKRQTADKTEQDCFIFCGIPQVKEVLANEKVKAFADGVADFDIYTAMYTFGEGKKIGAATLPCREAVERCLNNCHKDLTSARIGFSVYQSTARRSYAAAAKNQYGDERQ